MNTPKRHSVLARYEDWTPMRSIVFKRVFPHLDKKSSAVVFAVLYDRCYHAKEGTVRASLAQIAKWAGLDCRTVKKCLSEDLRVKRFVKRIRRGTLHSRTDTPSWKVPLASFELVEGKLWFFAPRFFFRKYCRKFPNAVVLLSVMYAHCLGWKNDTIIGSAKMAEQFNWSPSRVRRVLRTMGDGQSWRSVTKKLPRLLEIKNGRTKTGKAKRYFSVLAVDYRGSKRHGTVQIASDFAEHFDIPAMAGFKTPIRRQQPIRSHNNDHSL